MTNNFKAFLSAICTADSEPLQEELNQVCYEMLTTNRDFTEEEMDKVGELHAQYKDSLFKDGIPFPDESEEYQKLINSNETAALMQRMCAVLD